MRPKRAKILPEDIVCGHIRRVEYIADASEYVSAVVKRNDAYRLAERNACFEVDDRDRVAAERYGKRIESHDLAALIAKRSLRNNDDARPGRLKIESANRRRSAGEKSFADRENSVKIGELRRIEPIASRKDVGKTDHGSARKGRVLEKRNRKKAIV